MTAMPRMMPIATCPPGPIKLLSNAYFRKYATPNRMAKIPIQLNQSLPILLSRLPELPREACAGTPLVIVMGGCPGTTGTEPGGAVRVAVPANGGGGGTGETADTGPGSGAASSPSF